MKNVANENPTAKPTGRTAYSLHFVDHKDIKNKAILNIGCGYGWFEYQFFKLAKHITGIEISANDLKTAKKHIKQKNVSFQVGDALNTNQSATTFDTVVSWEVIEHIPFDTELAMFTEVNRVLKKNGIFYLSTPHRNFITNLLDPAWYLGHRHYSLSELKAFAKKAGFSVETVSIVGNFWNSLSLLWFYINKWVFRGNLASQYLDQKSNEYYFKPGYFDIFIKFKKTN